MITETAATIPEGTIKRLHVDQARIRANTKDGGDLATPLTCSTVRWYALAQRVHETSLRQR